MIAGTYHQYAKILLFFDIIATQFHKITITASDIETSHDSGAPHS